MKSILSVYYGDEIYGTAFFQGDELIKYIHENDGGWTSYFTPILNHFNIEVQEIDKLNKVQRKQVNKLL